MKLKRFALIASFPNLNSRRGFYSDLQLFRFGTVENAKHWLLSPGGRNAKVRSLLGTWPGR